MNPWARWLQTNGPGRFQLAYKGGWDAFVNAAPRSDLDVLTRAEMARLDEDSLEAYLIRLKEDASRGWAINYGESSMDEVGVASPVHDHRGDVVAAERVIDDLWDSGWTMTVVAHLLREAGTGPVLPLALARR